MIKTSTLELQIQFLLEERTEPYSSTVTGVFERKIGYGAKKPAGHELRSGAGGLACKSQ